MGILNMSSSVNIGGLYHRPSQPTRVYCITGIVVYNQMPLHVTLVSNDKDRHMITICRDALFDRRLWVPTDRQGAA